MFNGRQNNNGNGVNVNTRLFTSYSDTCMISLGAWNDKLSLKFHPFKGVNADGIRQYAQDNSEIVSTSLTVDNTTAFLDGIKDKITPALESKTEASVSITMGMNESRKVLTLSTDGTDVSLSVIVGVAEDGTADTNNMITHKFNKKEYMAGYDPATGSGEVVSTNADYENFVKKLEGIYDLAPTVPHAINYSNAVRNSYGNRQQTNNNNNGGGNQNYQAPVNNYSGNDMTDFLPFQ